ncbi:V-type ATP synthase subunit E [mine drainage metagenome]|uniref:V-type ATP synthase subunit E n=1 Tax=mine drainage metagenome TaxID=410659 RepID=T1A1L7_9ZZZZ
MGLDEILKNTGAEADEKIASTLSSAKKEADKIRENADAEAKGISESYRLKADREVKQILNREQSRANIEAKAALQQDIDIEIERAYAGLRGNMDKFIASNVYPKLLSKLAKDAYKLLGSGCTIEIAEADEKRLKAPTGCTVSANAQIKGGLIAYSKDRKKYVDYSLDRIMESIKGRLAKRYSEIIRAGGKTPNPKLREDGQSR